MGLKGLLAGLMFLPLLAGASSPQSPDAREPAVSSVDPLHWSVSWLVGDQADYQIERCRSVSDPVCPVNSCLRGRLKIEILKVSLEGSVQRSVVRSPFGTALFTTHLNVLALRDPERTDTFDLQAHEQLDTAQLYAAPEETVRTATAGANSAAKERELQQAVARMSRNRQSRYRTDPRSSWARQVSWRQTLNLDGRQRIDQAEFVRVD